MMVIIECLFQFADNIHMYIVLFVKVNIGYLKFIENVYTSLQGEIVVVREESFSLKI